MDFAKNQDIELLLYLWNWC